MVIKIFNCCFYVDKEIPLWEAKEELLQIEDSDFEITNNTIGLTIIGDKSKQKISLWIKNNINNKPYPLLEHSITDKIKEFLIKRPFRPNNQDALHNNNNYSTNARILIEK